MVVLSKIIYKFSLKKIYNISYVSIYKKCNLFCDKGFSIVSKWINLSKSTNSIHYNLTRNRFDEWVHVLTWLHVTKHDKTITKSFLSVNFRNNLTFQTNNKSFAHSQSLSLIIISIKKNTLNIRVYVGGSKIHLSLVCLWSPYEEYFFHKQICIRNLF